MSDGRPSSQGVCPSLGNWLNTVLNRLYCIQYICICVHNHQISGLFLPSLFGDSSIIVNKPGGHCVHSAHLFQLSPNQISVTFPDPRKHGEYHLVIGNTKWHNYISVWGIDKLDKVFIQNCSCRQRASEQTLSGNSEISVSEYRLCRNYSRHCIRTCKHSKSKKFGNNDEAEASHFQKSFLLVPTVLRILDMLVRIRILWSVPLTSGSGSGSCSFRQWPSRCQNKIFWVHYFFKDTFNSSQIKKSHKEVTTQ